MRGSFAGLVLIVLMASVLSVSGFADSAANKTRHIKYVKYFRCVVDEDAKQSKDDLNTPEEHDKSMRDCLTKVQWKASDRSAEEKRQNEQRKSMPGANRFYGCMDASLNVNVNVTFEQIDKMFEGVKKTCLASSELEEKNIYGGTPVVVTPTMRNKASAKKYAMYARCVVAENEAAAGKKPATAEILKKSSATCFERLDWSQNDLANEMLRRDKQTSEKLGGAENPKFIPGSDAFYKCLDRQLEMLSYDKVDSAFSVANATCVSKSGIGEEYLYGESTVTKEVRESFKSMQKAGEGLKDVLRSTIDGYSEDSDTKGLKVGDIVVPGNTIDSLPKQVPPQAPARK